MKRKVSIVSVILFLAMTSTVFAHTGLERSTPENGETVQTELKEMTLLFETNIEKTSTFEIKETSGGSVPVVDLSVDGKTLSGSFDRALENGDYQVLWNIIGVDGHPIKGELAFSVDVPKGEVSEKLESDSVTDQQETKAEEKLEDTETDSSSILMPTLIGILILVLVGSLWYVIRRKK